MNSRQMTTDRLALHVRVEGQGPPLLFLGGSNFDLSLRSAVFDSVLIDHFTVAAADPRGLGKSAAPAGPWLMSDYAADAVALMDALDWQSAFVLGESFGAMVGLELSLLAGHRVERLALAAGAPGGAGGSSWPIHELLDISDPRERAIRSLGIQDMRFAQRLIDEPQACEQLIDERIGNERRFLAHEGNATGYARLLATRATHDCWNRLTHISTETIIIAGEFDGQAPLDRSRAMADRIPDASLHVFPFGHTVCFASAAPARLLVESWAP